MRYKIKDKGIEDGSIRIKRFFAFWPVKIGKEVRWLEMVSVKQHYYCEWQGMEDGIECEWENLEFID
jgi:hypothetical protein